MSYTFHKHSTNVLLNFRLNLRRRLEAFQAFVITTALYGCETWNERQEDVDRLESLQLRLLRRILGSHWSERLSFATVIHKCRSAGVDILPIGVLISKRRLSYFGHVCRMKEGRLPKILLSAQIMGGEGLITGGQEHSYKKALLKDIDTFRLAVRQPGEHVKLWEPRRWQSVYDMAQDRTGWRRITKVDGTALVMEQWYSDETYKSNKRHQKSDGSSYVPKIPYVFRHTTALRPRPRSSNTLVNLSSAIASKAVTVGRGRQERRSTVRACISKPNKPKLSPTVSFVQKQLQEWRLLSAA